MEAHDCLDGFEQSREIFHRWSHCSSPFHSSYPGSTSCSLHSFTLRGQITVLFQGEWITIFHHLPDVTKFVLDCDWQGQWNFGLMFHSTDNNPLPFPQLTELEMSCLDNRLESLLTMIELRFHLIEDKSVASLTRVILRIQDATWKPEATARRATNRPRSPIIDECAWFLDRVNTLCEAGLKVVVV
ncbi:hypothetical protein C8J56DRAFT_528332 [Mycena floridula]|nr:hypothetical protein C8J56DRAFT_528332 [Mycena floridula]